MELAKHWKTIIDTLQDGLLVVDPRGIILAVNPAAERLTGYTAAELIGQNCRILDCTGCEIIGKGVGAKWCTLFSKGTVRAKKCLIADKDHRAIDIIKNASVLRDADGRVIGAVETLKDISELVRQQQEIESLRKTYRLNDGYHGLLGKAPAMQNLFELIETLAQSDSPVLIHGQSGTGKELVARAIHDAGSRKAKPFIKVNCAALNESLLESELFGHVKGAFTGAERLRIGRFEAAQEGTIFLDEIGDIPLSTQVKLLRVLEEREIERVGDHQPIRVDVRIISASNQNLERLIVEGLFREDLFFRINVFPLSCPALAKRREDIPMIVQNFIDQNNLKKGKQIRGIKPEAMEQLFLYSWPGNVRELRNAIEYAFVLCRDDEIGIEHLPPRVLNPPKAIQKPIDPRAEDHPQKEALIQILREAEGNQSEAARRLGVSRVTVWKRIKNYGIDLRKI